MHNAEAQPKSPINMVLWLPFWMRASGVSVRMREPIITPSSRDSLVTQLSAKLRFACRWEPSLSLVLLTLPFDTARCVDGLGSSASLRSGRIGEADPPHHRDCRRVAALPRGRPRRCLIQRAPVASLLLRPSRYCRYSPMRTRPSTDLRTWASSWLDHQWRGRAAARQGRAVRPRTPFRPHPD
jgi:hypothetical protein